MTFTTHTRLIAALLLFLTGCKIQSDYQEPTMDIAQSFKEAPEGWKMADAELVQQEAWWSCFQDEPLNTLMAQVEQNNQSLAVAQAQYEQSYAQLKEAEASYFPTLSSTYNMTRAKDPVAAYSTTGHAPYTASEPSLTLSWTPDLFGAVDLYMQAQKAGWMAGAASNASNKLIVESSVATTYFQLRKADHQQVLYDNIVGYYEHLSTIADHRYQSGVDALLDCLAAQSQLETARIQAFNNRTIRAQYEHELASLVGVVPVQLSVMPTDHLVEEISVPLMLPSTLLEKRPDIVAAERNVAQAYARVGMAQGAYFPILTLTPICGSLTNQLAQLATVSSSFWSLGLSLAQTYFDGGLKDAQLENAQAVLAQSVAQYRQTVLTAFQSVEDSLTTMTMVDQELQAQRRATEATDWSLGITRVQYQAGVAARSDILNAQITEALAMIQLQELHYQKALAAVTLMVGLGGQSPQCERAVGMDLEEIIFIDISNENEMSEVDES